VNEGTEGEGIWLMGFIHIYKIENKRILGEQRQDSSVFPRVGRWSVLLLRVDC
jgi:hypothetical protein